MNAFYQRIRGLLRRIRTWSEWHITVPLCFILAIQNWWAVFRQNLAESGVTYRMRCGLVFTVPSQSTDVNPFTDIWLRHVYDSPIIDWENARTIVDIGAHIGMFSLYAAHRAPQATIIAVEPEPASTAFLRLNVRQNHLENQITIKEIAVGERKGTAVLHVVQGRGEANSLFRTTDTSHDVCVAVTTLQDIFDSHHINHCDILKINAEGAEYEILRSLPSAYFARISSILMNYHLFVPGEHANRAYLIYLLMQEGFSVEEQGKRILIASKVPRT